MSLKQLSSPLFGAFIVKPAVSHKGTFKSTGAVFDGWETRRHNSGHDWCIIRLGAPSGYIVGFDIDTAHFSGNEAPQASVQGLFASSREKPQADDPRVSCFTFTPWVVGVAHDWRLPRISLN